MRSYLSPAKVNLCLLVKGRRADGYHEITTLMQAVDLFDTLVFTPLARGIEVLTDTPEVPGGEANIVWRAAHALLTRAVQIGRHGRTGRQAGIRVTIQKRIPVAAGLGGGSSNAATTLLALNDIFHLEFDKEELLRLGASLGADVPFFIFGKTAWAHGIGDILEEAKGIPAFHYLIINPGFPLSTREVYAGLKIALTNKTNDYSAPAPCGVAGKAAKWLVNDLESVSLRMYPKIGEIKRQLLAGGAQGALMSGSGPSVFGIFASAAAASMAAQSLAEGTAMEARWRVFVAKGLPS